MKVLHCIHSVNPAGGGPIEFIRQIAELHKRRGTRIELASLDSPDSPWVKDFPCKVHALGPSFLGYGFSLRWIHWLRKNHKNYDIIVVNGIWQYSSFGTWLALRDSQTPYVVFSHGMLDPWFKEAYPLKHLKKCLYWPFAEYWTLKDAAAVLFTSEEERILARQSFPIFECNEIVVGYGAASPPSDIEELKGKFREYFPELKNKRVLLFLGRIHEKKGCDLLIKAFSYVLNAEKQWHLLMAGPAVETYLVQLKDLQTKLGLNERITWSGMVAGDVKWAALCSAEALVLPSHQENFGVVVAEALACGTPVMISNKVNIWREVKSADAGLVGSDTESGVEEMLSTWLALSQDKKANKSENAKRCFEDYFDVNDAFKRLMDLFHKLIEDRQLTRR